MTLEERKKRAKEKLAKLDKATQGSRRTRSIEWKPKAKIVLHPASDILERNRIWFPTLVELSDEEKKKAEKSSKRRKRTHKLKNMPFNVPGNDAECAFGALRIALKEREDIDGDDTVLKVGTGRDAEEYCKGEILKWDDYNFKKSLIPRGEVVLAGAMIEHKGDEVEAPKMELFIAAKSLGEDIKKEIKAEQDESGEDEGNPFFEPYPFLLKFDADAMPADMYTARALKSSKIPKDVVKMFDKDPPDGEKECELADVAELYEMLKGCMIIDDLEFEPEGMAKPRRKKKVRDEEKEDDKSEDEEDDENDDSDAGAAKDDDDKGGDDESDSEDGEAGEDEGGDEEASDEEEESDPEPEHEPPPKTTNRKKKPAEKESDDKPADKKGKKTKKIKTEKGKGKGKGGRDLAWVPKDGEDYDVCPKCNEAVPQDAMKCPHNFCDAVYEVEGDPFGGED